MLFLLPISFNSPRETLHNRMQYFVQTQEHNMANRLNQQLSPWAMIVVGRQQRSNMSEQAE